MKYLPFLALCVLSFPAFAENHTHSHAGADLMPAMSHGMSVPENAPAIYLSMDKSELVHLDGNASSIIVGNPVHANVLMDTPQMLVVVPRAPGATHFTVLDQAGKIILQRHVIVAAPKENYIRVRTAMCGEDADQCVNTKSFYCEDEGMCHQIVSQAEDEQASGGNNADGDEQASGGNQQPGEEPQ